MYERYGKATGGYEVLRLPYWPDARQYYARIRGLRWPVWLDSGFPQSGAGRYDVIAADPCLTLVCSDGETALSGPDGSVVRARRDPLAWLRELLGPSLAAPDELPFCGGAIGYIGYDLARTLGQLPPRAASDAWPEMAVGLYDWAVVVDHATRRSHLVRACRDLRADTAWPMAAAGLQSPRALDLPALPGSPRHGRVHSGLTRAAYDAAFERIQRYIHDGDCYQVNFAQRFSATIDEDAWTLFQRLREANPAPYGALLEYPFGEVLSLSPEQFLGLRDGRVQTRPIKGTRARGATAAEDIALRAALRDSAKDRAENLMIVDLLRNDLGKVCVPGSIDVPALFEVESFATVHHLVSTVSGRLRPEHDALDLIAACFPGGSITGAPKRRAMQIIDELEPVRREVYCGNVIRLGYDGNLDSSIAIRTVLKRGGEVSYWAGGGIVADSGCAAEYQESLDKAAAFLRLFTD